MTETEQAMRMMKRRISAGLILFALTLAAAFISLSLAENQGQSGTMRATKAFRQAALNIDKRYVVAPDSNLLYVSALDGVARRVAEEDVHLATAGLIAEVSPVENVRQLGEAFFGALQEVRRLRHEADVQGASMGELIRSGLSQMVTGLARANEDNYSYYLSPKEAKRLSESLHNDSFGGVGIIIEFKKDIGKILILSVLPDTPAYRAGLETGDLIIRVDAVPLDQIPIDSPEAAKNRIRGKIGTKVTLTVEREGVPTPLDLVVTRDKIDVKYTSKLDLGDSIGYIRIDSFASEAAEETEKYLEYFNSAGAEALILDLRSNPGGLLEASVEVAALFLPPQALITYTQGRAKPYQEYRMERKRQLWERPLAVLVNQYSASASEIVTGALKDHDRAIIVGTKTFGKGSVQEIFPLGDQSRLRLTVAHYYTPSGVCIHRVGIEPNIEEEFIPPEKPQAEEAEEAEDDEEDLDRRSYAERRREALLKDNQVQAAIQALKAQIGRVVSRTDSDSVDEQDDSVDSMGR